MSEELQELYRRCTHEDPIEAVWSLGRNDRTFKRPMILWLCPQCGAFASARSKVAKHRRRWHPPHGIARLLKAASDRSMAVARNRAKLLRLVTTDVATAIRCPVPVTDSIVPCDRHNPVDCPRCANTGLVRVSQ